MRAAACTLANWFTAIICGGKRSALGCRAGSPSKKSPTCKLKAEFCFAEVRYRCDGKNQLKLGPLRASPLYEPSCSASTSPSRLNLPQWLLKNPAPAGFLPYLQICPWCSTFFRCAGLVRRSPPHRHSSYKTRLLPDVLALLLIGH